MSYVPLEKLINSSHGSLFKLVVLVSRRALELADGGQRLIGAPHEQKVTTVALREIAAGKVFMATPKKNKVKDEG